MEQELFNVILFVIAFAVYWNKKRKIDVYFLLIAAFALTAILCWLYKMTTPGKYTDTTFISYLYLFICVLISLSPFKGLELKKIYIKENIIVRTLIFAYIVSGFMSIAYTIPNTVDLINSGEWNALRLALYDDPDQVELYHSQLERFAKNVHSYLAPFGIVVCFYKLSTWSNNKLISILLLTSWIGNELLGATLVASRGLVVSFILNFLLLYTLFKRYISKGLRKGLSVIAVVVSVPIVFYMMVVSFSRFGETDAGSSVFMYLGHSMLNFNQNVMGTMHDYAWGKYFFNFFIPLFNGNPDLHLEALGYKGGTGFYTYVGAAYIDWGPVFTMVLLTLLSLVISHFTRKRVKRLSDIIIIVFFAQYFMNGVFVIGRGAALQWAMCFLVYSIIKISEVIGNQIVRNNNLQNSCNLKKE